MPNISTSKKITKNKQEVISIIIISPCLGYKTKFNRKIPMIYYGDQPAILYHIEKIKERFTKAEVFLVAGEFCHLFKEFQNGFGIIENQLYSVTGEIEQLRLGIQACSSNKILILKEKSIIDFNKFSKLENSVYLNDDDLAPSCVVNNSVLENISYGIPGDKFSGCFSITNKSIGKFYDYSLKEHNKNKMLYEAINDLDIGFKVIK